MQKAWQTSHCQQRQPPMCPPPPGSGPFPRGPAARSQRQLPVPCHRGPSPPAIPDRPGVPDGGTVLSIQAYELMRLSQSLSTSKSVLIRRIVRASNGCGGSGRACDHFALKGLSIKGAYGQAGTGVQAPAKES